MKRFFRSALKSVLPVFAIVTAGIYQMSAQAQEPRENVMLVLDASGSMWGQIDAVSKIEIARGVIADLLDNWDPKRNLGLMAYGHRRKGDCGDIQTLRPVGPVNPAAMKALVNSLNPRGKTPLSAAVGLAAQALKYSEEKATVILVSDGLETCAVNTCEAARALEATGVDLTVHVIGFDLAGKDTASLQCIAQETGGQFFSAANASELSAALEVVAAPAPPPGPTTYGFRAVEGANGPQIDQGLLWFLTNLATNETPLVAAGTGGGIGDIALLPGDYRIEVLRASDENTAAMDFVVVGQQSRTLTLVLPPYLPAATVSGPAVAPAGTVVQIAWTGPNDAGDYITVVNATASDQVVGGSAYTKKGSPVSLRLPETPGPYELRYLRGKGARRVLGRAAITVTPTPATLAASETIGIGAPVQVAWTGPNNPGDYITIVRPEAKPRIYGNYAYTKPGSPVSVAAPDKPGTYEIRYITAKEKRILARRALVVEKVEVTLGAAPAVPLGSQVAINWTGPNNQGDYITIVKPQAKPKTYGTYAYTKAGSPTQVRAPETPGAYEIRYISGQSKSILATAQLAVQSVTVTLVAPPQLPAGSAFDVVWTGPGNKGDYITIVKPSAAPRTYGAYKYTKSGSPARLRAPDDAGAYELRYITGNKKRVLLAVPVSVMAVTASLQAPATAPAGSQVEIAWQGPNNKNDYVDIAENGAKNRKYLFYRYTAKGSPVSVQMPDRAGTFELRYVTGKSRKILARRPITLSPISASLEAGSEISAGKLFSVTWQGPNNKNDYIVVVPVGEKPKGSRSSSYKYTAKGSPVEIRAPKIPGAYTIHYLSGQSKRSLASRAVTVK
ncbi:MAG: vWA domain-containing protein [Alphaproteobacteria bacterium]